MTKSERIEASFSGHVQGVGFRFTTLDIACRFPRVTGYVRNTPDGRVEIVAEGPPENLKSFLNAIQGAMAGYIHNMEAFRGQPTGEFVGFNIRH